MYVYIHVPDCMAQMYNLSEVENLTQPENSGIWMKAEESAFIIKEFQFLYIFIELK